MSLTCFLYLSIYKIVFTFTLNKSSSVVSLLCLLCRYIGCILGMSIVPVYLPSFTSSFTIVNFASFVNTDDKRDMLLYCFLLNPCKAHFKHFLYRIQSPLCSCLAFNRTPARRGLLILVICAYHGKFHIHTPSIRICMAIHTIALVIYMNMYIIRASSTRHAKIINHSFIWLSPLRIPALHSKLLLPSRVLQIQTGMQCRRLQQLPEATATLLLHSCCISPFSV